MKPERPERIKRQRNGLLEPYTVMLDGRPVVVREARSIEDAIEQARTAVPRDGELMEKVGDGE